MLGTEKRHGCFPTMSFYSLFTIIFALPGRPQRLPTSSQAVSYSISCFHDACHEGTMAWMREVGCATMLVTADLLHFRSGSDQPSHMCIARSGKGICVRLFCSDLHRYLD